MLMILHHVGGDSLKREEKAFDVDFEHAVVTRARDLEHRRHIEDGGVVDEDVDGAAPRRHGSYHVRD